ncbi:MAG TPA: Rdx family protein [Candidatus Dormibacteraeota bacterium]
MAAEILVGWAPVLYGLELKTGTKGVFKVFLDGERVFDKSEAGHLPGPGEVKALLEPRLGAALAWRKQQT